MQDSDHLSAFASVAGRDFYIRVYASFELIMKHKERWLIVPSAACDTVDALKHKIAREIKCGIEEISVFLPARCDIPTQHKERELLHQHGITLLSYGIFADVELRLVVFAAAPSAAAHRPHLSAHPQKATLARALPPPAADTTQQHQRAALVASNQHLNATLQQEHRTSARTEQPGPGPRVNPTICTVMLGNFGEAKQTSFSVPAASLRSDGLITLESHLKFLQCHIQEKFNIHAFYQDIWSVPSPQLPVHLSRMLVFVKTVSF
jgi:hypothetical protein